MATYHLTAEPVAGQNSDPRTCPLVPQDFMADSDNEAIGLGEQIVAEDADHIWQCAYAAANDATDPDADEDGSPLFHDDQITGNTEAADRATAYIAQWRVVARRVERPAVALFPHGAVDPVICNGVPVFFGSPTVRGSFDVLVDGVASGHLYRRPDEISGKPTWRIGDAVGLLAALADRRWNDYSADYAFGTERWLEGALADIRSALSERPSQQMPLTNGMTGAQPWVSRWFSGVACTCRLVTIRLCACWTSDEVTCASMPRASGVGSSVSGGGNRKRGLPVLVE
jgi:hypothetical protein